MALINANINSSNSNANTFGSFFKNGVSTVFIKQPKIDTETKRLVNQIKCRILPAFNMSLYARPDFKQSTVPYRDLDSGNLDKITRTPEFTPWAQLIRGYTYFGVNKSMFVSPLTGKAYIPSKKGQLYPPDRIDPIVDLVKFIRFNKDVVPTEALQLLERDERGFARYPTAPTNYIISNALIQDSETETWRFGVIAYTQTAYTDLIKTLSVKTGRNEVPVTPEFEDFLFGDITDSKTGSVLTVVSKSMKYSSGGSGSFAGFQLSYDDTTLKGRIPAPELSEADLSKRVILNDDEYLDIWSYQQILNEVLKDGSMPIEVIEMAMNNGNLKPGVTINTDYVEEGKAAQEERDASAPSYERKHTSYAVPQVPTAPSQPTSIPFANSMSTPIAAEPVVNTPVTIQVPTQTTVGAQPVIDNPEEYKTYLDAAEKIKTGQNVGVDVITLYARLAPKYGQVNLQQ